MAWRAILWRSANALAVGLAWLLGAALVTPAAYMLAGSLWDGGRPSLQHWAVAFADHERQTTLLIHSLIASGGAVLVALALGGALGLICARTRAPGRRLVVAGAVLAASVPVFATGTAWMALLGSSFWLRLDSWQARALGAAWLQGLAYTPHALLLIGIGFARANAELEDAARLEGGRWAAWRLVIVPGVAWWFGAAALVVLGLSFTDITITDLLRVRTYPEEVYTQFQAHNEPWPAAALAVPGTLALALLVALTWHRARHLGELGEGDAGRHGLRLATGPLGRVVTGGLLLGAAALLVVPLASLVLACRSVAEFVVAARSTGQELGFTLVLATLSALLGTAWAAAAAWLMVRRPRWRTVVLGAVLLLLATPAPIVGEGLILLLNRPGPLGDFYGTPGILVLAQLCRVAAYGVLCLAPVWRALPVAYDEQARVDGANWLQRLLLVFVPAGWRALLATAFLLFTLAVNELGASMLVAPPGITTLSVRFATLLHTGVYPDAAGLCLMMIAGVLLPGIALTALLWRSLQQRYV